MLIGSMMKGEHKRTTEGDFMREAKFVATKDVFAKDVERLKKAVTRYEEFLANAWSKRKVYDATRAFEAGPLGAENIQGVGVGEQITAGKRTGRICIKIYVAEKAPEEEINSEFIVPKEIEGEAVDVEAVGLIEAFPFKYRYRPAPGGVSIGHVKITAGTLGCFCASTVPKEPMLILSNNHVLANSNHARIGDHILQPGTYDGGKDPRDWIAELFDFVPIDFTGKPNLVDAAIAKPRKPRDLKTEIIKQGKVKGAAPPTLRTRVKKSGRTTQNTRGTITGVGATVKVSYGSMGRALFKDQVVITPGGFSAGGDSGSAILDGRNRVRALLFAGSSTHTIASPIQNVISQLSSPPRPIRGLKILDC